MQNFIKSFPDFFIFIFRISSFSLVLISYFFLQTLVKIIFFFYSQHASFILKRILAYIILKIFSVEVEVYGKENTKGCFIAANHSSTLDIPLILQVSEPFFITSMEVGESFLTGLITRLSDTIFVERRKKSSVLKDAGKINAMVRKGVSICLFPEGTSSNGTEILKFKSSLFQAIAGSGVKVQPICIRYDYIFGNKNSDKTAYYGNMTFLRHIYSLCLPGKIKVYIDFCEQFSTEGKDRKDICAITEKRIREKFNHRTCC